MKKFFAKNYIAVAIIVLLAAAGGAYWYVSTATPPTFGAVTVAKGNVVQSVDEPGSVLAENSAVMSFQEGGQIAQVNVSEGSQVAAGTVLADLDSAQLSAAVQQAQAAVSQANAGLAAAQAQLSQLASGTRPQQITIDESAVASADQTLGIAVGNAYSASDDAVRNQLDNMFSNAQSNNPAFLVPSNDAQGTVNSIQNQRVQIGAALAAWYASLNATSTGFDPASLSAIATANLQQIQSYIDTIALVVNNANTSVSTPAATLAQYKGNIAAARAEIEASNSAVSGNQSALTAAQNVLALAQAGSTSQAIAAQQAVVAQAQAAVAQAQAAATSAQVALDHSSLVAPFGGTVQNLTAQVGQVVSPGVPMMTLINASGLKIETYVSEKDVANIKSGDAAQVTLDAFGTSTTFPATVGTVDAAQTQINGAAAYMVTLHFVNPNGQIKDGMTGNVHIIEAEHDNVIAVPSNLVINDNNAYFVLVQKGSVAEKVSVQIGLVGASTTEITSGLNVGDTITNF
ncbi:MAG: efflux RND transporter periplasmic adaptor subunit [Minisyncoccia bacterium]|jgi:RND family efflux transporter MFP subunit